MSWVWEHSRSKKTERLVLLAIADCASEDGSNAYPSTAELMRKTGLSERGVQGAIGSLVTLGELFVSRNGGPRGCNRYRVIMATPQDLPPQQMPPADDAGAGNAGGAQDAGAEAAPPQETTPAPADLAPGTVLDPPEKNSSSKSSSTKRGTRIPADFAITDEMRTWAFGDATELRGREPDPASLDGWLNRWTAEFIDYWTGRSGAGATKVDWVATWRNRMRTKLEQLAQQSAGNAIAPRDGPVATRDRRVAQVDVAVDNFLARANGGTS